MKKVLMLLAIFAPLLASCNMQRFNFLLEDDPGYKNPHTACAHCHGEKAPQAGKLLFLPQTESSEVCLDCHSYEENHHPVNFTPVTPISPSFPLYNGKLRCLSCHEIHGGPQRKGSSKLLRGGPYRDRRTICFDCHAKEKYEDIDPHTMLDKNGRILQVNGKSTCLICHEVQPDPTRDREENVHFRADVGFLCWRCHMPMHGSFFDKHFLVRPSEKTMEYINRPEIRDKFALPMVPWGRINCSTCHNPHQAGVILHQPAASGAGSHLKLRAENICEGCHNIY